ncbi:hypothetical protein MCC93_10910 [Morococcus cerebrosus]|uniref:Uncharacterized protein n=1 Tax=Morococcus cerebrosus TaxID=1056807 RepID=A0A0C1GQW9_9NEIS|nr:hypothetical protein MCC93_10910 [Morococcus cerebrosus]
MKRRLKTDEEGSVTRLKNGGKKILVGGQQRLDKFCLFFGNFICLFFNQLYFLLLYQLLI